MASKHAKRAPLLDTFIPEKSTGQQTAQEAVTGATRRPEQQSAPNAAIRQHAALTDAARRPTFATVSTDEHFATQHPNGDVAGGRTAAQFTKTVHNESTNPDCSTPRDACRAVST